MCGRYSITSPPEALRQLFGYRETPNFPPRYNVAPTQPVPIVRLHDGAPQFVLVRWGLVPSWAKEVGAKPMINARSETVAEKPFFRSAFKRRRCLLPADGFYEWQRPKEGPKVPFNIHARDGRPFAMAGVWEHWMGADGSELESCAILTTDANATLAPIHHRMPVILDRAAWDSWLDPDETSADAALRLLRPAPDDILVADPVSTRVNRVANDDAQLIEPLADATPSEEKPRTKAGKKEPGSGQMSLL